MRLLTLISNTARRLWRFVVAVAILPLVIWQTARAYGHGGADAANAASSVPLKTTLAGSSTLLLGGGLTANDLAMLAGAVGTVVGLLLQAVLGWRRDQRERRESEARLRHLDAGRGEP